MLKVTCWVYGTNSSTLQRKRAQAHQLENANKAETKGGVTLIRAADLKRFRGGLTFEAHRLVNHSTLGWRVIKKKKERGRWP